MRAVTTRLIVTLALALSATSLAPLASASADVSTAVAAAPTRPTIRIYAHPRHVTRYGVAPFSYGSNQRGVQFRCRLRGPGRETFKFHPCKKDSPTSLGGRQTWTGLRPGAAGYRFWVQAYVPATDTTPELRGPYAEFGWHIFTIYRPNPRYVPRIGASFNRPLSPAYQRINIDKMINTINAMPGYLQGTRATCPWNPALRPASIRITLYSLTGIRFARALAAAHRRCVSVQVLMNNHLDRNTDGAWRYLEDQLGTKVYGGRPRRSFAKRCSYGCRGSGVLHTKMYLFDSSVEGRRYNKVESTVAVGSSNMTFNATNIQYNDLYTVRNRPDLYRTYLTMFNLMKRDRGVAHRLVQVTNGSYQTTFWPQDPHGPDPQMAALRSIRCTGVTGGTGYRGRTVVRINMHAWFNTRGLWLARQVRSLYNQGCYVKVLYGFMSYGVYKILHNGTGSRMSVRRTLFSHDGYTGYVYTHFKNILASGRVGSDRSARVVWTGSNNFTNGGTHYDEVMMRIPFSSAYYAYRDQFSYMSNRLSSPVYAIFQEPEGGGRPPRMIAPRMLAPQRLAKAMDVPEGEVDELPPGTPVITSPAVVFDENGEPRALD